MNPRLTVILIMTVYFIGYYLISKNFTRSVIAAFIGVGILATQIFNIKEIREHGIKH